MEIVLYIVIDIIQESCISTLY